MDACGSAGEGEDEVSIVEAAESGDRSALVEALGALATEHEDWVKRLLQILRPLDEGMRKFIMQHIKVNKQSGIASIGEWASENQA